MQCVAIGDGRGAEAPLESDESFGMTAGKYPNHPVRQRNHFASGGSAENVARSHGVVPTSPQPTRFGDCETFDAICHWTELKLRRPADSLFIWRWVPIGPQVTPDLNNATDGDVFIAWALIRAGERGGDPSHAAAARTIVADIRNLLVRHIDGRLVLLPGANG
jgi:endo-1,4-beta-D-glucanase Y